MHRLTLTCGGCHVTYHERCANISVEFVQTQSQLTFHCDKCLNVPDADQLPEVDDVFKPLTDSSPLPKMSTKRKREEQRLKMLI